MSAATESRVHREYRPTGGAGVFERVLHTLKSGLLHYDLNSFAREFIHDSYVLGRCSEPTGYRKIQRYTYHDIKRKRDAER